MELCGKNDCAEDPTRWDMVANYAQGFQGILQGV